MTEWRTINTAPQDGSKVDVCRIAWGEMERITDVWWSVQKRAWVHWGNTGFGSNGEVRIGFEPSHWMDIPGAPPSDETNEVAA